jgi:hypothetical protein
MRSLFLQFIFLLFIFSSCNQTIEKNEKFQPDSISLEKEIPVFLKKFKLLPDENLSLFFEGSGKDLPKLNFKTSDTLFVSDAEGSSAYGMLPDTSRFYILLWYKAVENGTLMLSVIDKKGKIIDEEILNSGQYGWDCGYQWHGQVYIYRDKTILLRDSIVTYNCEGEEGPAPDSTWKFEIDSMTGIIKSNGKIEFSKLKKSAPKLIK